MKLLSLIAAPEGIAFFRRAMPDVPIHVAAVDEGLNEVGFIYPGLGDAGDRQFGTGVRDRRSVNRRSPRLGGERGPGQSCGPSTSSARNVMGMHFRPRRSPRWSAAAPRARLPTISGPPC